VTVDAIVSPPVISPPDQEEQRKAAQRLRRKIQRATRLQKAPVFNQASPRKKSRRILAAGVDSYNGDVGAWRQPTKVVVESTDGNGVISREWRTEGETPLLADERMSLNRGGDQ
jgi:hypothetical protein